MMTRTGKIDTEKAGATAKPRSRNAAIVLALCVIAGVGGWLWLRRSDDGPKQTVTKIPQGQSVALIQGGTVFLAENGPAEGNLPRLGKMTAIPGAGNGPNRVLALPPTPVPFQANPLPLVFADDRNLLIVDAKEPESKLVRPTFSPLPPALRGLRDLGGFALPASFTPPAPRENGYSNTFPGLRQGGSVTVWRLPLSGEAATKAALDTQGLSPAGLYLSPAAQGAYWLRQRTRTNYTIVTEKGRYNGLAPSGDMMFSPLDGTPPRVVATGLYDSPQANRQIIAWKVPGVYPDASQTLHCLRLADGPNAKEYTIKDFKGVTYWGLDTPVDFEGRFYWIELDSEEGAAPSRGGPPRRTRVVSQTFDGSDYRVIAPGQDAQGFDRRYDIVQIAGGKLYVTYEGQGPEVKRSADGTVTDAGRSRYISRLHPDQKDALGSPLEANGVLDDGYCYFDEFRKEPGFRQTFDFLFSSADSGPDVNMLSRLPLPE